jgi:hypothetical protein
MTDTDWVPFAGSAATTYLHTQGVASTTWTVNHPLGGYPAVTIVDSGGNDVEGAVSYVSTSELTITFGQPMSGVAQLS